MALWWVVPTFEQVEVWPGRGFLVTLPSGDLRFVRDLAAQLPAGVAPDDRFWNPPPLPRRTTAADARGGAAAPVRRRPPARRAPRPTIRIEEPERYADPWAGRSDAELEQLPYAAQPSRTRARTSGRARALLMSLLDARQQHELATLGHFWVHGDFGSVRLGRLYDLVHRSADRPDVERRLCVVTRAHREIPPDDEWTSMLLTLAHDPDRFFAVANVREAVVFDHRIAPLRRARDELHRLGDEQHLAYVCADLGAITGGDELDRAVALVERLADLDPPSRDRYLAHHEWIVARARDQRVPRAM